MAGRVAVGRGGAGRRAGRGARAACGAGGRGTAFWGGLVIGGAVAGAAGFLFAPQISRLLLERTGGRAPRFVAEYEDDDPEDLKVRGVFLREVHTPLAPSPPVAPVRPLHPPPPPTPFPPSLVAGVFSLRAQDVRFFCFRRS